jgi:hypothetical protein
MAAYVAMAHIVSARPHRPGTLVADAVERPLAGIDAQLAELDDGPALDDRLAERWSYIRDRWAQTTFYLFDPESWR